LKIASIFSLYQSVFSIILINNNNESTNMEKATVKGELFVNAIAYIHKKWGADGLDTMGFLEDQFKPDTWYGLDEFCQLLDSLYKFLHVTDPTEPFKIGKWIVTSNMRWAAVFQGKDPGDVFTSNQKQKKAYNVGEFRGVHQIGKEVSIHSTIWTDNKRHLDLWAEFYRGRLTGVLELTGRCGQVTTVAEMLEKEAMVTYKITWH